MNYYNDNDPYACKWTKNLIRAGLVPDGEVDRRSIARVQSADLGRFRQAHFFSGICGWPYALRLAGWPDDRPIWTGSCPCQPFSNAGKQMGYDDKRHLWPEFYRLIAECRPPTIVGEQVASALGRAWLAGVRTDLEALGYAVGAADLCAAGVGAPHIRQRLFWVADAGSPRLEERPGKPADNGTPQPASERAGGDAFWSDAEWLRCLDGKSRRVKPGIFPLAGRVSARVGRLRAIGNAIVPQVAAEFVAAFMETRC